MFNETAGSSQVLDYSGNGFHAAAIHGPSFSGTSVRLHSGSRQYLSIDKALAPVIKALDSFTVSVNVRLPHRSPMERPRIFSFGRAYEMRDMALFAYDTAGPYGPTYYYIRPDIKGEIYCRTPSLHIDHNAWYSLTITYDGPSATFRTYRDGREVGTCHNFPYKPSDQPLPTDLFIGRSTHNWFHEYFDSEFKCFRMYSRALLTQEVLQDPCHTGLARGETHAPLLDAATGIKTATPDKVWGDWNWDDDGWDINGFHPQVAADAVNSLAGAAGTTTEAATGITSATPDKVWGDWTGDNWDDDDDDNGWGDWSYDNRDDDDDGWGGWDNGGSHPQVDADAVNNLAGATGMTIEEATKSDANDKLLDDATEAADAVATVHSEQQLLHDATEAADAVATVHLEQQLLHDATEAADAVATVHLEQQLLHDATEAADAVATVHLEQQLLDDATEAADAVATVHLEQQLLHDATEGVEGVIVFAATAAVDAIEADHFGTAERVTATMQPTTTVEPSTVEAAAEQPRADITLTAETKTAVVSDDVQLMQMHHSAAANSAMRAAFCMGVVASGLLLLGLL
jgi:hypothetical protein